MTVHQKKEPRHRGIAAVFNGAIAGFVGTAVIFPLDFAKTYLQNQTTIVSKNGIHLQKYKNIFDVMIGEVKAHGVQRLYKGLHVNLLLVMPEKAIKLSVNELARRHYGAERGQYLPLKHEIKSGCIAGMCQVVVTTPMEFFKIQYQMDVKFGSKTLMLRNNLEDVVLRSLVQNGVRSLYRGFLSTLARDVLFSAIYFPSFAILNARGYDRNLSKPPGFGHVFVSAIIAGLLATVSATPLDVIKTRLQLLDPQTDLPRYSSFKDCFNRTLIHDGYSAFFKGVTARAIVIPILFGIAQAVYFMGIGESLVRKFER